MVLMMVVEDVVGSVYTQAYASKVNFNITTEHKNDSRAAGLYLSYKITLAAKDYKDFEFSGFDNNVTQTESQ